MGIGVVSVSGFVLASADSAAVDVDAIRISLHLLSMAVWIGGQVIMMALLPLLREVEGLPAKAAQAFGRVAWPAFAVAVATGIWNILVIDMANVSTGYNIVLGLKLLLVVAAGVATAMHQRATTASMRGATAGIAFLASIIVVIMGAMLAH
jgi:cytochrome bd-type quinol oxidase subunit 2